MMEFGSGCSNMQRQWNEPECDSGYNNNYNQIEFAQSNSQNFQYSSRRNRNFRGCEPKRNLQYGQNQKIPLLMNVNQRPYSSRDSSYYYDDYQSFNNYNDDVKKHYDEQYYQEGSYCRDEWRSQDTEKYSDRFEEMHYPDGRDLYSCNSQRYRSYKSSPSSSEYSMSKPYCESSRTESLRHVVPTSRKRNKKIVPSIKSPVRKIVPTVKNLGRKSGPNTKDPKIKRVSPQAASTFKKSAVKFPLTKKLSETKPKSTSVSPDISKLVGNKSPVATDFRGASISCELDRLVETESLVIIDSCYDTQSELTDADLLALNVDEDGGSIDADVRLALDSLIDQCSCVTEKQSSNLEKEMPTKLYDFYTDITQEPTLASPTKMNCDSEAEINNSTVNENGGNVFDLLKDLEDVQDYVDGMLSKGFWDTDEECPSEDEQVEHKPIETAEKGVSQLKPTSENVNSEPNRTLECIKNESTDPSLTLIQAGMDPMPIVNLNRLKNKPDEVDLTIHDEISFAPKFKLGCIKIECIEVDSAILQDEVSSMPKFELDRIKNENSSTLPEVEAKPEPNCTLDLTKNKPTAVVSTLVEEAVRSELRSNVNPGPEISLDAVKNEPSELGSASLGTKVSLKPDAKLDISKTKPVTPGSTVIPSKPEFRFTLDCVTKEPNTTIVQDKVDPIFKFALSGIQNKTFGIDSASLGTKVSPKPDAKLDISKTKPVTSGSTVIPSKPEFQFTLDCVTKEPNTTIVQDKLDPIFKFASSRIQGKTFGIDSTLEKDKEPKSAKNSIKNKGLQPNKTYCNLNQSSNAMCQSEIIKKYNLREENPMIGLEYVIVNQTTGRVKCLLCPGNSTSNINAIMNHVNNSYHQANYLKYHFPKTYSKLEDASAFNKFTIGMISFYATAINGIMKPIFMPNSDYNRIISHPPKLRYDFLKRHYHKDFKPYYEIPLEQDFDICEYSFKFKFSSWALKILSDHLRQHRFLSLSETRDLFSLQCLETSSKSTCQIKVNQIEKDEELIDENMLAAQSDTTDLRVKLDGKNNTKMYKDSGTKSRDSQNKQCKSFKTIQEPDVHSKKRRGFPKSDCDSNEQDTKKKQLSSAKANSKLHDCDIGQASYPKPILESNKESHKQNISSKKWNTGSCIEEGIKELIKDAKATSESSVKCAKKQNCSSNPNSNLRVKMPDKRPCTSPSAKSIESNHIVSRKRQNSYSNHNYESCNEVNKKRRSSASKTNSVLCDSTCKKRVNSVSNCELKLENSENKSLISRSVSESHIKKEPMCDVSEVFEPTSNTESSSKYEQQNIFNCGLSTSNLSCESQGVNSCGRWDSHTTSNLRTQELKYWENRGQQILADSYINGFKTRNTRSNILTAKNKALSKLFADSFPAKREKNTENNNRRTSNPASPSTDCHYLPNYYVAINSASGNNGNHVPQDVVSTTAESPPCLQYQGNPIKNEVIQQPSITATPDEHNGCTKKNQGSSKSKLKWNADPRFDKALVRKHHQLKEIKNHKITTKHHLFDSKTKLHHVYVSENKTAYHQYLRRISQFKRDPRAAKAKSQDPKKLEKSSKTPKNDNVDQSDIANKLASALTKAGISDVCEEKMKAMVKFLENDGKSVVNSVQLVDSTVDIPSKSPKAEHLPCELAKSVSYNSAMIKLKETLSNIGVDCSITGNNATGVPGLLLSYKKPT